MVPVDQSALRWLASMEERKRGKRISTLAPWDEQGWFDTPVMTEFTTAVVGGQVFSIAKANPQRVVLMISAGTNTGSFISIRSDVSGTNNGYQVLPNLQPFIFTQADHGVLCQVEWFAFVAQFATVEVIEVVLRDWPR